jgi:hypothetical protein
VCVDAGGILGRIVECANDAMGSYSNRICRNIQYQTICLLAIVVMAPWEYHAKTLQNFHVSENGPTH